MALCSLVGFLGVKAVADVFFQNYHATRRHNPEDYSLNSIDRMNPRTSRTFSFLSTGKHKNGRELICRHFLRLRKRPEKPINTARIRRIGSQADAFPTFLPQMQYTK
jgi:hypothetical protein